ncbi:MAG: hypothetical protein H0V44_17395 [Planctomycetes bacterium]|nr:hypothetical protein [Planctomycetota bacterium]
MIRDPADDRAIVIKRIADELVSAARRADPFDHLSSSARVAVYRCAICVRHSHSDADVCVLAARSLLKQYVAR